MEPTAQRTEAPRRPRQWLELAAVLLVVFALPALFRVPVTGPAAVAGYGDGTKPAGAPAFDLAPLQQLRAVQPDYLFVGNSNTTTRIDEQRLGELLDASVLVQATDGTTGVHWYLQLVNHLIPSGARPRTLFVLFRDDELLSFSQTRPELLLAWSQDFEPAFEAIHQADCTTRSMRMQAAADRGITALWPLAAVESDNLYPLADALTPAAILQGRPATVFHTDLNRRFGLGHMRPVASDGMTDLGKHSGSGDFAARARCSVLPHLLQAAADAELDLVLVRVQRRTWTGDDQEIEALVRQLADFAADHGVPLVDFSGDPEIPAEWYGTVDHIADEHRETWTELFHQRVFVEGLGR